jgi:hypothetical protein
MHSEDVSDNFEAALELLNEHDDGKAVLGPNALARTNKKMRICRAELIRRGLFPKDAEQS